MDYKKRKTSGFTLIELSIVLVIVALLVAGILLGKDMIENAKIRRAVSELEEIPVKLNIFKLKYNALAGDMSNATSILTDVSNGNGNGKWEDLLSGGHAEVFYAWKHLYAAGLSDTNVSGTAGSGGSRDATVGLNAPSSKSFPGVGFGFSSVTADTISLYLSHYFIGTAGTTVYIGGDPVSNAGYELFGVFLTGTQAHNLDSKMDDGKPGTGIILGFPNSSMHNNNCSTTDSPSTAIYTMTDTQIRCSLIMRLTQE